MLRLYCPGEGEEGKYCVLSHCWGVSRFVTNRGNIEAMQEGFEIGELPGSFRDAMRVCRALRVKFLWIDSVCIVQGDR